MKSGKPKTKRYQFGGTLRSQISGTRNAPPPKRPAPAPAKPTPTRAMPPQVKAGAASPVPPPPRSTIAPTPTLAKTTFSNPAVAGGVFDAFKKAGVPPAQVEGYTKAALQQGKSAGLGAMPATPTKTTGGPFNLPAGTVGIPQTGRAPSTKTSLSGMLDILSGRAPAPTTSSAPNKPSVGYADDLAGIYAAAKNQPQIFGPQAPMPAGGPRPAASTMPATTATAKPAPLSPQYMKKGGAVKAYAKGGKVSSASSRGDGIAQRGKTRGKMV